MNIITPPRIDSLESRTIRVVDTGGTWSLKVYPFDSILFIKQQIALHYKSRGYLPPALYLAAKGRPLEFRWPFATTLPNPTPNRTPSSELMEGDVRKPVFPTLLAGVTFETMGAPEEIEVWPLPMVVKDLELTPTVVAGFVQLYYPGLETVGDVEAFLGTGPLTDAERKSLETMEQFHEARRTRLAKLEGFLGTAEPTLHELRAFRAALPTLDLQEPLEILFHTMIPTRELPILRYFAANQRQPPLLKLAMNPAGIPLLADAKLLRTLLGDAPAAEGAMILGKVPLVHPKAPYGAAWVLRIHEDGTGEIVLGAPRRDAPLPRDVVVEAFQQLRGFLQQTPWKGVTWDLQELTAVYKYTLQEDVRKPTKGELRKRADPFLPLFKEEAPLTGETALTLRWKAVSNFEVTQDPVMSYIADLFLKESLQSVDAIPVAAYVTAITREFGLGAADAAATLNRWIHRHAEYVLLDAEAEKVVAKYSPGALVSLHNHHPDYLFSVAGVDSYIDLRRIVSMLGIWVSHTSQELATGAPMEEAVPEPEPEPAPEPEFTMTEEDYADFYQTMEMYGDIAAVQNLQPVEPVATVTETKVAETDIRYPDPLGPDEPPLPQLESYLIQRLQAHDADLFTYKVGKEGKLYSRVCQNSGNKQPNVMSPEAYRRVRAMYGDSVHWVEAPLSKYELAALQYTSKAIRERLKNARTAKKPLGDVLEYEKHMLRIGMPLKDNASIVSIWPEAPAGAQAEMTALIAQQKSKPLWLVLRAGASRTNYYICSVYWCIRDDLPLIDDEFHGTTNRRGAPKAANTCPFCGGKEIRDKSPKPKPKVGETVLARGSANDIANGPVAKYVGFREEVLIHPKGYPLPCCFVDPASLKPPAESQPFPAPLVELPAAQQGGPSTPEEKGKVAEPVRNLMDVFQDVKIKLDSAEVKGLPMESFRYLDRERTKAELRAKAIVRAYIVAASSFPLELGKVGLVSESMDAFLGQTTKNYLESPKHGKIYTHPKVRGQAFFRLGLGTSLRNVGTMMLQLIAYARAVVSHIVPPYQTAAMTPDQLYTDLFETQEVLTFQAFQQANYGTLVSEFADPDRKPTPGELQTWCGRMGIPLPAQRGYAEMLWGAWHRFKEYVRDAGYRKELRLWEHLFTAPGLFTATGVILAVITTDENDHVILRCPSLGIAPRHQAVRPPLMLVYEDRRSRIVEPLILYEGPDQLLGVLDPESVAFGGLSPALRVPLTAFYGEYFDPKTGCGRPQPVLYPWLEDAPQSGIPRLGSLLAVLHKMEVETRYLLRDRSQRLVGVVVSFGDIPLFVPALDDGAIDVHLGSQYDLEGLPVAPLGVLLQFLVGPSVTEVTGLAKYFTGMLPVELRSQGPEEGRERTMLVALETKAGPLIPLEPLKVDAVVAHPMMTQLRGSVHIDYLPWISATVTATEDQVLLQNPEERLEEAYQHVRLTLSQWLQTVEGRPYKRAIEDLRGARTRLPLYELRKRLDLLLLPTLTKWIHVGSKGATQDISTLRRNCIKVPKGECQGACVWADTDQCMIHAAATDRFVDPVLVIGARIVDELLRTNEPALQVLQSSVPRLRPPVGIVREKDTLLVSFTGRGDAAIFRAMGLEGRLPGRYTQGHVIPEELGAEDVGCEGSVQGIPLTWEGVTHMVWPAEAVGQSLRDIAWAAMVGAAPERDEGAFYERVAAEKGWNILFTRDTCHGYRLAGRIGPNKQKGERTFVILTPERVPLGSAKTKQPRFMESELPSAILAWLDESPKEEKAIIEEVLETEGEEEILPFEEVQPVLVAKEKKPCPEGKERSSISGLCVKKCELDEVRSENGHCKKVQIAPVLPKLPTPPMQPEPGLGMVVEELTPTCPPGLEVSQKSGACVAPCKQGQMRNPDTGHCIQIGTLQPVDISKYDIGRCEKSKGQSAAFPFKKEDVLEALKEQGVKARKSWTMAELCSYVTDDTLRVLSRRRDATRKNGKVPPAPAAPAATPEPNMSQIDMAMCPKGMSLKFPFKREELIDSLREDNVFLARSSTLAKICPHVTQETLRRILKRTRKNVRSR